MESMLIKAAPLVQQERQFQNQTFGNWALRTGRNKDVIVTFNGYISNGS